MPNSEAVTQIPFQGVATPKVVFYNVQQQRWEAVDSNSQDFPIVVKQVITPEWAEEVLAHRNRLNRPIAKRRVDRYARDILTGQFHIIHQGIAFYADGDLADGQQRLSAVAQAKVSVTAFVTYGLHKDAGAAIDEGRPRSDRDVAHLSGMELSAHFISTANYLLELLNIQATRQEKLRFYETHKDAINFAANNLTKKFVARAPILAAIAKAYYTQNRTRLIEFMDVLQTGQFAPGKDDAAFRLREYATLNGSRNDGPFRRELYDKTKSAIIYFLEGKAMPKLYGISTEPFRLPEEEQMKREQEFLNRSQAMQAVQKRLRQRRTSHSTPPPELPAAAVAAAPVPVQPAGEDEYGG
jgi:hypothetical protein